MCLSAQINTYCLDKELWPHMTFAQYDDWIDVFNSEFVGRQGDTIESTHLTGVFTPTEVTSADHIIGDLATINTGTIAD